MDFNVRLREASILAETANLTPEQPQLKIPKPKSQTRKLIIYSGP